MITNSPIINNASLTNRINRKFFSFSNKGQIFDRDRIINNYNQETINACWEALSTNIIQNYERGK